MFEAIQKLSVSQTEQQRRANLKYRPWNRNQVAAFKKNMLAYGYGRWSKFRQVSAETDHLLSGCSDREMRPYANWFMVHLYLCCEKSNEHQVQNKIDLKELKVIIDSVM